ncbi:hypothetical protein COY27_03035 [Candidatus Woesearchaeota archaeon CG_4_10_14_0_2_um_filter_33_13]|nr:MAG: hypothetical protein COY27_03035 [Candidatus Woesearchaeota archaeon CG_4_10_14_0_2_um_filter_33_13]
MLYQFAKDSSSRLNLGLAARSLRDVRLGALTTFLFNYLVQEYDVKRQEANGLVIPTAMDLEVSTFCPRRCRGCYVPVDERKDPSVISYGTASRAIGKGIDLGMRNFNFIGGEPLQNRTIALIERLVAEHPSRNFFCCTNGELLATTQSSLDGLVSKNNFSAALSVDGFKETNDKLRGRGSYGWIVEATRYLHLRGCFYGGVVTVRESNFEEALSDDFVDSLIEQGLMYTLFAITDDLPEERKREALKIIRELKQKPLFIYNSLTGHTGADSRGCMARELCVNKDGKVLSNRKERIILGDIDTIDVETISRDPDWRKRFNS